MTRKVNLYERTGGRKEREVKEVRGKEVGGKDVRNRINIAKGAGGTPALLQSGRIEIRPQYG